MKERGSNVLERKSRLVTRRLHALRDEPRLPLPRISHPVYENEIRLLAYLKWEAAGKPPGEGVRFWLEAEQELLKDRPRH